MGMAAGQARLLSITSRMSDNELRAQIINNNKMRLATESSNVSEEYVTALNNAKMMFTNYDANNNKSYQDLTFASMTAYNQYNNQYGLSNMAGQLLVSEKDANRFKAAQTADNPLNTFLESYGLKYETSFFNNDQLGKYMEDGKLKLGIYTAPDGTQTQLYSNYTPEEYKTMYLGDVKYADDGKTIISGSHLGYDASFNSQTYIDYDRTIKAYNNSYQTLCDALPIREFVGSLSDNGTTLNNIYNAVTGGMEANAANLPTLESYLDKTMNILGTASNFANKDGVNNAGNPTSTYYDSLIKSINNFKEGTSDATVQFKTGSSSIIYVDKSDEKGVPFLQIKKNGFGDIPASGYSASFVQENEDGSITNVPLASGKQPIVDENGNPYTDDEGNPLNWSYTEDMTSSPALSPDTFTYTYRVYDGDGNEIPSESYTETYKVKSWGTDPDIEVKATQSEQDADSRAEEIYNFLNQTLGNYFTTYKEQFDFMKLADHFTSPGYTGIDQTRKDEINVARDQYKNNGKELAKVIFGETVGAGIPTSDYQNLIDLEWVQNHVPPYQDSFQAIIDITALEELFDVYGEPAYGWVKDGEPDENATAEAKWYTNLFNRMSEGYKVLENGLATSAEWMQFALESGLVTMEQVDKDNNWGKTIYSNCSDITEQTDNLAVTKAEAEYKKAMNKIESKDKRYDLDLKNIDTEHNSLQTEYDSIKTAIDKNIERTFKMYS